MQDTHNVWKRPAGYSNGGVARFKEKHQFGYDKVDKVQVNVGLKLGLVCL